MRTWRLILVVTVFLIIIATPLLIVPVHAPHIMERWLEYAPPSVTVAALLSWVFLFSLPQTIYVIAFIAQWALIYVVGLPLGNWIVLELVLSMAVIIQFALVSAPYVSIPTTLGAVLFMASQQGATDAWEIALPAVSSGDLAGYIIVSMTALSAATTIHVLLDHITDIRTVSAEKNNVIRRLVDTNMEYQRYALEVEKSTVQSERERISREIHDTVGYTFTNQRMMLQASTVLFDRDHKRLKELIVHAQESLAEGYQHVRSALRALRKVGGSTPTLNSRIYHLTRQFSDVSGVEVRYEAVGLAGTGSPELDQAIFRCIQEGITNAFCHGAAKNVTVTLARRDDAVHLRVLDDGRGSQEVQEGIGITGMRERLDPFHGIVNYRTLSPGFVLEVEIPHEHCPR